MASFKKRKVEETLKGGWSDLPHDIIGRIMEKLCWADRIRLPAVCKSWSVPRGLIPVNLDFPWLLTSVYEYNMEGRQIGTQMELYDPLKEKSYRIVEGIEVKETGIFSNTTIWCSRFGWLLLRNIRGYVGMEAFDDNVLRTFLFSPLTGDVIKLPMLEMNIFREYKDVATFSMSSTCPECTIFIFWRNWNSAGFSTCRLGDNSWKSFQLKKHKEGQFFFETDDHLYPVDAVYLVGSFYCLFRDGEVGVFNIALQHWKLLEQFGPRPQFSKHHCPKFVRSGTDLLLYEFIHGIARIWRYDFTGKCWINEQNSGDRQIFIGYSIEYGFPLEASELADKIHLVNKYSDPFGFDRRNRNIHFGDIYLPNFEEKELQHPEMNIIWFDHRLVWRKSDLLRHTK